MEPDQRQTLAPRHNLPMRTTALVWLAVVMGGALSAQAPRGYYRSPALHGATLVFASEGDLWRVSVTGGVAQRLTSNLGTEGSPVFSPDGKTIAFTAEYEGATDIYTIPAEGGLPRRRTWDGVNARAVGFTPKGEILISTSVHATLPDSQLIGLDLATGARRRIPLAQADQGVYEPTGKTLFFTRLRWHGNNAKRYKGGTAQQLWKYTEGTAEAVPLTADFAGTSREAMWWQGRVYFATDRDGAMNIWSMTPEGKELKQHTRQTKWDVLSPALSGGKIAFQCGADIHVFDIASGRDTTPDIRLATDADQTRERWIEKPFEWVTAAHISPDGSRLALTARGQVWVMPAEQGRWTRATHRDNVRYRDASLLDAKNLLVLSDASGEVEIWKAPANGAAEETRLTQDGKIVRWRPVASPDGQWVAHSDKSRTLYLTNAKTGETKAIAKSRNRAFQAFEGLTWSPDSKWLAYSTPAANNFDRVWLYSLETGRAAAVTSERFNSGLPEWSPDGQWLYLVSDRNLKTDVTAPWGPRQPEPHYAKTDKVYQIALRAGLRSPFAPADELHQDAPAVEKKEQAAGAPQVVVEWEGIEQRLLEVPVPAGDYSGLAVTGKTLYLLSGDGGRPAKRSLVSYEIKRKLDPAETVAADIRGFEMSGDRKKLLILRRDDLLVAPADKKIPAAELAKSKLDLTGWQIPVNPREMFRQMFREAWRLERDYFYDPKLHNLDWTAVRELYEPLAERVADRAELNDLLGQMLGELSALHLRARGGEARQPADKAEPGALGAVFERVPAGFRVARIYASDPDLPPLKSPLARPGADIKEGDTLVAINGAGLEQAESVGRLLLRQAGKQVLVRVQPAAGGAARDAIVTPLTAAQDTDLRYHSWEYSRRLMVEKLSGGRLGYVHLRAMGPEDMDQWTRDYYPVYNREALIVDVRHNRGGNIDPWILSRLMRKAWFYWQPRESDVDWNMQWAFRGPMAALVDEFTASDGEAFAEGFKRLGLGQVLGKRTWGGEIWLSSSNVLVDRGVASAAEMGVYGPDGQWLIEGHGVDPDVVVDNLPHATFEGSDAQLEAAVKRLLEQLKAKPVTVPPAPGYPDKRFAAGKK